MIVIGVDVHKQSVTAVAVDEAGRILDERTVAVGSDELIGWASRLDAERLWALEDCRLLTPWLERQLLGLGEELVRVSPKLTVAGTPGRQGAREVGPNRRARGRQGGAQGAGTCRGRNRASGCTARSSYWLIIETISSTSGGEPSSGCAGICTSSTRPWSCRCAGSTVRATSTVVGRWLARREQDVQVRIARELVNRCRTLTRAITELNHELGQRAAAVAPALLELPGCGAVTAAKLLAEIGPISRFKTDAQLARHSGVAPTRGKLRKEPAAPTRPRRATGSSTPPSTGSRSRSRATTRPPAPTSNANKPKAKANAKRSAASNESSPAPPSTHSKRAPP